MLVFAMYCTLYTGKIQMIPPVSELFGREAEHRNVTRDRDNALDGLIRSLQEATELAAAGEESSWFTPEVRERWNRENPCVSRTEMRQKYRLRESVPYVQPNPRWQEVLQEYSKLHRACMHAINGDPLAYFLSKNSTVNCKFMVVDAEEAAGLGNRLVMIASAFTYALLTQRVLLVPRGILPPELLCEPFEGSSWRDFDPSGIVTPFRVSEAYWTKSALFHNRIDIARKSKESPEVVQHYAVGDGNGIYTEQPDSRFFCDTEQDYYKNVTWVYIMGCIYFTPKLYAVPSFRPVLDALFPGRMALTNVLRDVMPPSDKVWARVKSIEQEHGLQRADRRLGIQVRYRFKAEQFVRMHHDVENRILQCGIENDLLPPTVTSETLTPIGSNQTVVSVFVASLFEGVKDYLSKTYQQYTTANGERVEVVQLSHEGEQKYGVKIFQEALAEIVTLSFSDALFVTPQSTFSGVAQGYGGLVPWFIGFRETEAGRVRAPCTRGQTVDVCFQVPYDYTFRCAYDPAVNGYEISHVFPDIQRCLDADTPGLQLITDTPEGTLT
jgi:xyloglucan fucosyltransferase